MSLNSSNIHTCAFCNSSFSSLKSLEAHKKTAKYCLNLQGKNNSKFICNGCDKVFSVNHWLVQHQSGCTLYQINAMKLKYEERIMTLEKENTELKSLLREKDLTIKDLAEKAIAKPTTINNNHQTYIANLQIISEDHILSQAKNLTLDHIKKGAIGYSEYLLEYPLKERVICTDYSRRKIKYKNDQGELITDPEMTKLSDLLFKSIKERNRELTIQYSTELTEKFKTAKDSEQLAYFMEIASKFSDQDMEVFKMFNGDKNEFFHDIIRNVCSKTLAQ